MNRLRILLILLVLVMLLPCAGTGGSEWVQAQPAPVYSVR